MHIVSRRNLRRTPRPCAPLVLPQLEASTTHSRNKKQCDIKHPQTGISSALPAASPRFQPSSAENFAGIIPGGASHALQSCARLCLLVAGGCVPQDFVLVRILTCPLARVLAQTPAPAREDECARGVRSHHGRCTGLSGAAVVLCHSVVIRRHSVSKSLCSLGSSVEHLSKF